MQDTCELKVVSVHTGHKWLPFKLLEVECDLLQVNQRHLSVLQHGLLIGLQERKITYKCECRGGENI